MQLLERYNAALRRTEDVTVTQLNRILDSSFNRLLRRTRIQLRGGAPTADRNVALLQEFRELVPAFRPDRTDAYDRVLRTLLRSSEGRGITVARELLRDSGSDRRLINVSIPIEATVAAAAQARGYLAKHGAAFATTATELVAQGIAEGRPTDAITQDLRLRLGVVKSRADVIARTESLRAYNAASNQYYAANGIDLVMWYATSDDRTCPICNARAGRIYRRASTNAPCHPRCVLGDTRVTTGRVIAATRAIYRGDLVTIRMRSGRSLTVTAQHPVLTERGWIKAMNVSNGLNLISSTDEISACTDLPQFNQSPPCAEDIFNSLRASSSVSSSTVPSTSVYLHGDGEFVDGDISVVWADRVLVDEWAQHRLTQCDCEMGYAGLANETSLSNLDALLLALSASASGLVSLASQCFAFVRGELGLAEQHRLAAIARTESRLHEPSMDYKPGYAKALSRCLDAFSGYLSLDEVINVEINAASHGVPVYDFTTAASSYMANGILSHNCRCYLAPWDPEIAAIDPEYANMPRRHREEVSKVRTVGPADLNKAAVFEQFAPQPSDLGL